MRQALKYVNFYNLALCAGDSACTAGMTEKHDPAAKRITLALSDASLPGCYMVFFDSRDRGGTYNRLIIEGDFKGAVVEAVLAADDEPVKFNNAEWFIRCAASERKEKLDMCCPGHIRAVNHKDLLLHSLRGRYIGICLTIRPTGEGDCHAELTGMRLELPRYSFTEYFPEIYQETYPGLEFFGRYIGIFQSLYLDLEREVDRIPAFLDYRTAPDMYVVKLAEWLGIDNSLGLFDTDMLRRMIADIDLFQGKKGTKKALESIISLATGIQPVITEHFEWMDPEISPEQVKRNKRLYGDSADSFCVFMNMMPEDDPRRGRYKELNITEKNLTALIEGYALLFARFKLIFLHRNSHMGGYCYLDVNAALAAQEPVVLDKGTDVALGEYIQLDVSRVDSGMEG